MPISPDLSGRALSQEDFHELDFLVMGVVFGVHNDLGPFFCDEHVYRDEIAFQVRRKGIADVQLEMPVTVTFRSFAKTYFVDLMLSQSALYELKAVQALHPRHTRQTLTYLLLTGLRHGKLVNMYPTRVEHKFVSTRLTQSRRREYEIHDTRWKDIDDDSTWLKLTVIEIVADLGLFLDAELYMEILAGLRGGLKQVVAPIEVRSGSRIIGRQPHPLLNAETGFQITALTKHLVEYERHLHRFLAHTPLRSLQWINLNHHVIEMKTLSRK